MRPAGGVGERTRGGRREADLERSNEGGGERGK